MSADASYFTNLRRQLEESELEQGELEDAIWLKRAGRMRINVTLIGGVLIDALVSAWVANEIVASQRGDGWSSEFIPVYIALLVSNAMVWMPLIVLLMLVASADRAAFRVIPAGLAIVIPAGSYLLLHAANLPLEDDWKLVVPSLLAWILFIIAMLLPAPKRRNVTYSPDESESEVSPRPRIG